MLLTLWKHPGEDRVSSPKPWPGFPGMSSWEETTVLKCQTKSICCCEFKPACDLEEQEAEEDFRARKWQNRYYQVLRRQEKSGLTL